MDSTTPPSEATASGILTTLGSTIGLALGPSVIAVLTIGLYIPPIEQEFGWSRVQVSFAFTIVAYMIVRCRRCRACWSTASGRAASC